MAWRPTCVAPSTTAPPRTNCSRPSKPRQSLEAAWPTVWGSERSRPWSKTVSLRPRRPLHLRGASGAPPPHRPARRRLQLAGEAKRLRGEERADLRQASVEGRELRPLPLRRASHRRQASAPPCGAASLRRTAALPTLLQRGYERAAQRFCACTSTPPPPGHT